MKQETSGYVISTDRSSEGQGLPQNQNAEQGSHEGLSGKDHVCLRGFDLFLCAAHVQPEKRRESSR
jgi:hypothetical protein